MKNFPWTILAFTILCTEADAIKCWGANAYEWQSKGFYPECYGKIPLTQSLPLPLCWTQCGGVTLFPYQCAQDSILCYNPSNKTLCPYRKIGVNQIVSNYSVLDKDFKECKCNKWRKNLPNNNSCPMCNDFSSVPPLIFSYSSDASGDPSRVILQDCPVGYDSCFNYCVNFVGPAQYQPVLGRMCYYGCAKSQHAELLDLLVSSKLAEIDYLWRSSFRRDLHAPAQVRTVQVDNGRGDGEAGAAATRRGGIDTRMFNPVEYKCGEKFFERKTVMDWGSGAFGCKSSLCQTDGCNKNASPPARPSSPRAAALFAVSLLAAAAAASTASGPA